jgi:hypothetical protein
MSICFYHVFTRNYNYLRLDSLDFIGRPHHTGVLLYQDEDSVKRFRYLTSQEERQVSCSSHTLDRGIIEITRD